MSDRIEEIRERLGKASRGPWVHYSDGYCCDRECIEYGGDDGYEIGDIGIHNVGIPWHTAQFIANAPADVAFLLAEVERLEREKAEAWDEGHRVGTSGWLESVNPYKETPDA